MDTFPSHSGKPLSSSELSISHSFSVIHQAAVRFDQLCISGSDYSTSDLWCVLFFTSLLHMILIARGMLYALYQSKVDLALTSGPFL